MAYKLDFECTNNMAEYEALILGVKVVVALKIKDIEIYGHSQLVVNQVKELFDTKDEKLNPYMIVVVELLDQFDMYTIHNIPRTNNRYADAIAIATSLAPIEVEYEETILTIRQLSYSSYVDHIHTILNNLITDDNTFQDWYFDTYDYLKSKKILDIYTKNDIIRLRRTIMWYVILGDVLYRRSFDDSLLRCFTHDEIATSLEQAHEGLCGDHFHVRALYTKILRIGYYLPTMEEDYHAHVKIYVQYQKHANLEKQPTQEFNCIISP